MKARFNPDGIDFSEWIHSKLISEYQRSRDKHPIEKLPYLILFSQDIINQDNLNAGCFLSDLRIMSYPELGYPGSTSKNMLTRRIGLPFGWDTATYYNRIINGCVEKGVRGLKPHESNIIAQACWPIPGRNTLPWLLTCKGSVRDSFDRLTEIIDIFKTLWDSARMGEEKCARNQPHSNHHISAE